MEFLVTGAAEGYIPDYQLSAWLMAVWFKGLSDSETWWLTQAMAQGGMPLNLSEIPGIKVDKHSTGGVGDKTTLVVAPLAAAGGIPIAKMSGRGLGFTGGTLDKLQSIPGFRVELTPKEFLEQVEQIGVAIIGAGKNFAPADKRFYALRDVTATMDSIPLIASSVMSKKIAGGADALVLDVKYGSGAFMTDAEEAVSLAKTLLKIAQLANRKAFTLVTNMDEPLGKTIGNSLEVSEAIETLKGHGPSDFKQICLLLTGAMLWMGGKASNLESGKILAENLLDVGAGLEKFAQMVAWQGGCPGVIYHPELLPSAKIQETIWSEADGIVTHIDAGKIGRAAMELGAGRIQKDDAIDPAAGIQLCVKSGDTVHKGDPLAVLYTEKESLLPMAILLMQQAIEVGEEAKIPEKMVYWTGSVS